ncbi:Pentatricopeptide repeat-containing protein [Abeliophyllum distichum]|uniref:Pentatricopeptide repeat-containing protein n=1 Tax=Abeliophyllum distichum TaxID=126358 RepID=A0ABD1VXU7_9LAMI
MGYQENAYVSSYLISSCARNGFVSDALIFVASDNMPLSVVSSNGMELFGQMKSKYRVEPEMDHYLLVIDLLARYGYLKEAERLILGMPFPPNALIWRSFLEGCKRQRTMEDLALAA